MANTTLENVFLNIKLEERKVDTTLAEAYFKENNFEFYSPDYEIHNSDSLDILGNKVYYSKFETKQDKDQTVTKHKNNPSSLLCEQDIVLKDHNMFALLAKEVEKNLDLICQLEYLIRKVPTKTTKTCDVKLITDHFIFNHQTTSTARDIVMYNNAPLALLALVMQTKPSKDSFWPVNIISMDNTAIICHLFTNLCTKVGLAVKLAIVKSVPPEIEVMNTTNSFPWDCTAVITEKADLDSAIAEICSEPSHYPWELKQVLIQENILESYKTKMTFKINNQCSKAPLDAELGDIKKECLSIMEFNGRGFVFGYAGSYNEAKVWHKNIVLVEVFRTTEELLSVLNQNKTDCLSLWTNDISEITKIGHYAEATLIWINDFLKFDLPCSISNCFYQHFCTTSKLLIPSELALTYKKWQETTRYDRYKLISRVVEDCKIFEVQELLLAANKGKSSYLGNGKLCLVTEVPVGYVHLVARSDDSHIEFCLKAITSLIYGNAVILTNFANHVYKELFVQFMKNKFPIYLESYEECIKNEFEVVAFDDVNYKEKVLICSF